MNPLKHIRIKLDGFVTNAHREVTLAHFLVRGPRNILQGIVKLFWKAECCIAWHCALIDALDEELDAVGMLSALHTAAQALTTRKVAEMVPYR